MRKIAPTASARRRRVVKNGKPRCKKACSNTARSFASKPVRPHSRRIAKNPRLTNPAPPMNDFDTLFPNFLNQCTEMNHVLTPIAFVLLAIGIVSSTVTGHRSPGAYLRTIGRTLAFAAVLAYLPTWSNEIATTVDSTVKNTLHADPAGVYQQYQQTLAIN